MILDVVSANVPVESLDPDEVTNLWATVDYTTMTQILTSGSSQAASIPSPNWDYLFDMNMSQNFSTSMEPITPGTGLNMQRADRTFSYHDTMTSGVSPFSALFQDDGMNFRP